MSCSYPANFTVKDDNLGLRLFMRAVDLVHRRRMVWGMPFGPSWRSILRQCEAQGLYRSLIESIRDKIITTSRLDQVLNEPHAFAMMTTLANLHPAFVEMGLHLTAEDILTLCEYTPEGEEETSQTNWNILHKQLDRISVDTIGTSHDNFWAPRWGWLIKTRLPKCAASYQCVRKFHRAVRLSFAKPKFTIAELMVPPNSRVTYSALSDFCFVRIERSATSRTRLDLTSQLTCTLPVDGPEELNADFGIVAAVIESQGESGVFLIRKGDKWHYADGPAISDQFVKDQFEQHVVGVWLKSASPVHKTSVVHHAPELDQGAAQSDPRD